MGQPRDLSNWIALLSRFNNGHPLNKEIVSNIEGYFDLKWNWNKTNALKTDKDLSFMSRLPEEVQQEIMIDYLFSNFLLKYERYFIS